MHRGGEIAFLERRNNALQSAASLAQPKHLVWRCVGCGVRGVGWGGVEAFGVKWFDNFDNVELEGGASEGKRRWRRRTRRWEMEGDGGRWREMAEGIEEGGSRVTVMVVVHGWCGD